jgi:hypothetical protein
MTPCSSLRRTTSQSAHPHTQPNEAGGSGTSIRSEVSTFEPASTTSAARSAGLAAPWASWLRDPAEADRLGGLDGRAAGLERHSLPLGVVTRCRVDVAFVREDTGELDPVERCHALRELNCGGTGEDAEAAHAGVELEQHLDRESALARRPRDAAADLVGVDGHRDRHTLCELDEPGHPL